MTNATVWYAGGLQFTCQQCGNCCAGPGEGYIWVTRPEIKLIAEHLNIPVRQLRREYLRRVGLRVTVIEDSITKDCIFLSRAGGKVNCRIYPVRPVQCRTWPFWPGNLADQSAWGKAARKCPGIKQGGYHSLEQIRQIIDGAQSWYRSEQSQLIRAIAEIYQWLDAEIAGHPATTTAGRPDLAGLCSVCGECCDFDKFGHKLFVTTPEMIYLTDRIGIENIRPAPAGRCPWQNVQKCSIYEHRFSPCRIFCCKGDAAFQGELTEQTVRRFKQLCERFGIAYRYMELADALKDWRTNSGQSAEESSAGGRAD